MSLCSIHKIQKARGKNKAQITNVCSVVGVNVGVTKPVVSRYQQNCLNFFVYLVENCGRNYSGLRTSI